MRAVFVRALILLVCVAVATPLSTAPAMMAQEDEDDEGMLYCYCYFDEGLDQVMAQKKSVSMELQFPAAGGQVKGTYRSRSVAGDMSRLYYEDGTYGDFMEDCTVDVTMQFEGFYSGDASREFSLAATGTATVDIDNSGDDLFDRSYRAELINPAFDEAATADGIRNRDGSVTISAMSGQFVPVSMDANEIPNTEWVQPEAETISPNLTLICTTEEESEAVPQMSCSIATTPDQIGPQDTTFQASGTASGFAGETTWEWTLSGPGKYEKGQGQNPTMYWGGTTYAPGYYELHAQVTDGQYVADCAKHFAIGDVEPNSPPQCLDVRVLPSSPAAGTTSLRAEVDASDPDKGDSLSYSFRLLQGTATIGTSPVGAATPGSYTFSVAGGLQPGPHTVRAYVFDGHHNVACQHYFVVPGAGQPVTQPPTMQPSVVPVPTQVTIAQPSPTQPVQTTQPPQTSCTITTIPDPIGPQDTTIQTKVTVKGFRAPRADPVGVRGPDLGPVTISGQGMSTTLSWPVGSLGPGFYTLSTWVYEESPPYYWAECATHFTIGDRPNNPPECQITGLNPPAPSVGDTSLEVTVQGRDADGDSLNYRFNLQGSMVSSGVDVGPQYTFSIPGGLQPGTYTVMVSVDDGKHWNYCQFNLLVPGAPPVPTQSPPAVPVVPTPPIPRPPFLGPPKAPQPPTAPPQPPAPPPVPPPTGDCGPVQVIYLDDLGVGMNQAEIDAFVENALAVGGSDLSLVLSHRQALVDRFGQQGFQQIDGLLDSLGTIAETCPFILIVGDPDVIPFAVVANPTEDGDVLFTDDIYGDNDHDVLALPDIPVARIPDGHSLDLLVTQLSPSSVPESGDFTLANSKRTHADGVASQVFGAERVLLWSLPTDHGQVSTTQVDVRQSYFMLHGGSWDTTVWWGEEEIYPQAFTVAEASSQGIVLSGSCYGGYTFGRTPDNSITLSFLESGARAFVGSTGITYSPMWTSGPNPTGPMRHDAVFHEAFLSAVAGGQAPLAAFMEAKQEMADVCRLGDSTPAELKMLHEFVFFGKP